MTTPPSPSAMAFPTKLGKNSLIIPYDALAPRIPHRQVIQELQRRLAPITSGAFTIRTFPEHIVLELANEEMALKVFALHNGEIIKSDKKALKLEFSYDGPCPTSFPRWVTATRESALDMYDYARSYGRLFKLRRSEAGGSKWSVWFWKEEDARKMEKAETLRLIVAYHPRMLTVFGLTCNKNCPALMRHFGKLGCEVISHKHVPTPDMSSLIGGSLLLQWPTSDRASEMLSILARSDFKDQPVKAGKTLLKWGAVDYYRWEDQSSSLLWRAPALDENNEALSAMRRQLSSLHHLLEDLVRSVPMIRPESEERSPIRIGDAEHDTTAMNSERDHNLQSDRDALQDEYDLLLADHEALQYECNGLQSELSAHQHTIESLQQQCARKQALLNGMQVTAKSKSPAPLSFADKSKSPTPPSFSESPRMEDIASKGEVDVASMDTAPLLKDLFFQLSVPKWPSSSVRVPSNPTWHIEPSWKLAAAATNRNGSAPKVPVFDFPLEIIPETSSGTSADAEVQAEEDMEMVPETTSGELVDVDVGDESTPSSTPELISNAVIPRPMNDGLNEKAAPVTPNSNTPPPAPMSASPGHGFSVFESQGSAKTQSGRTRSRGSTGLNGSYWQTGTDKKRRVHKIDSIIGKRSRKGESSDDEHDELASPSPETLKKARK